MLVCARTRNIGTLRELLEKLKITSGSICSTCVGASYVERFTYTRSTDNLIELAIPELNYAEYTKTELCLTISDSYTVCRFCTDSTICTTFKGVVNFVSLYDVLNSKGIEIPEPRPEIGIIELLSTIYESDGNYSTEKSLELMCDELYKRLVVPDYLVLSVLHIRECCTNMYVVSLAKNRSISLHTRQDKESLILVHVEPEIEDYPYISNILQEFNKMKVEQNSSCIIRFGKDEFWISLRKYEDNVINVDS